MVNNVLLPIMTKNTSGIYNNAFEMTCKNLMVVQIYRLFDIEDELKRVSEYDSIRNQWYNQMKSLHNNTPLVLTSYKPLLLEMQRTLGKRE